MVIGRVSFREAGDLIDCTKMGIGGKAIPPYIDQITDIQSDAEFILLVEKNAVFTRLSEDRFYNKFPCIMITGKGQPDVATRLFLRRMRDTLRIPVLGLVDADPYGLKILSVYMSGSKSMSYDSANLTTPDIKWLGVRPSDLSKLNIPDQCRLPMSASDIETGKSLLKEDFMVPAKSDGSEPSPKKLKPWLGKALNKVHYNLKEVIVRAWDEAMGYEGTNAEAGRFLKGRQYLMESVGRRGVLMAYLAAVNHCGGEADQYAFPDGEEGAAIVAVKFATLSFVLSKVPVTFGVGYLLLCE